MRIDFSKMKVDPVKTNQKCKHYTGACEFIGCKLCGKYGEKYGIHNSKPR